jgi:hypothetical protein
MNHKIKFDSDIDIDVADRDQILRIIQHVPASINHNGEFVKHNSGIYFTKIPFDPVTGMSTIDYETAENRGYTKIDLLNNSVYSFVRDEEHLNSLLSQEPPWNRLLDPEFFSKVVHINGHYDLMKSMPQPINSITRMAMFLALIRPSQRHLVGKPWDEVAKTVWIKPTDGSYGFKLSHSIAYSHLVVVHMNLLNQMEKH